jgi:putative ABC transport system permease protein
VSTVPTLSPRRLAPTDVVRVGAAGLRAHPLRVSLSALGIAIGIAAMVSIVGITVSGRAGLAAELARIGSNLLVVGPAHGALGADIKLPAEAETMIGDLDGVATVTAVGAVKGVKVYRTDRVPAELSNGITVVATRLNLPSVLSVDVAAGSWLTSAAARFPTVVLGARTAQWLGLGPGEIGARVWLGARWYTVAGILSGATLASELDAVAYVGWDNAAADLGFDGHASAVYARVAESRIGEVHDRLARTANPERPGDVQVSRPSDVLLAKAAADRALTSLLVGLGAVALLVGGVGVANTMVISVLERRAEIGLRRALGATRSQIALQFFTEAVLLSLLGGGTGVLLGAAAAAVYAAAQHWAVTLPGWAVAGALGATFGIGCLAGIYPATRAARLAPTEALASH